MNQDLFSEFKGSSDQEVRAQIQKDLNSLDFESTLCWESLEGIITQPFYDRNPEKQKKIIKKAYLKNILHTQFLLNQY